VDDIPAFTLVGFDINVEAFSLIQPRLTGGPED